MKVRGMGLLSGLLMMAACGGARNSQLSLELGYREANQLRELSLGIVPEKWEGSADSVEAWVRQYGGRVLSWERQEARRITLNASSACSVVRERCYQDQISGVCLCGGNQAHRWGLVVLQHRVSDSSEGGGYCLLSGAV